MICACGSRMWGLRWRCDAEVNSPEVGFCRLVYCEHFEAIVNNRPLLKCSHQELRVLGSDMRD